MALFRKRKQDDIEGEQGEGFVDDLDEDEREAEDAELSEELAAQQQRPVLQRPTGPWDVADAPADDLQRLDLGALQVPVPGDVEVRVELGEDGTVMAATLVQGDSSMQVNAFAAPRTEGIWGEVLEDIRSSVVASGGEATPVEGTWGTELRAVVLQQDPQSGATMRVPARFVGVDGPRWFLRALVTGPAADDSAVRAPLDATLRGVVVVRGTDPMAVRDQLPMQLPPEAEEARQAAALGESHDLSLPERGPEITEVR